MYIHVILIYNSLIHSTNIPSTLYLVIGEETYKSACDTFTTLSTLKVAETVSGSQYNEVRADRYGMLIMS